MTDASGASAPDVAVRHSSRPPAYPLRWVVLTAAAGVAGVAALVVPSASAGTWLGVGAVTWFSMLGFRLLVGGTTAAWGVEGTTVHARDLRGVHSVDTTRLEQVRGARLRTRYLDLDVLVLVEEGGRTVALRSAPGWRQGGLKASTLHVAHRLVRAAVAAGRVPHVDKGAREVLDVPGPVSDARPPTRSGVPALLYASAVVAYVVALAVVVA